jgi:putative nucleotidyltransferase with HDIG domain
MLWTIIPELKDLLGPHNSKWHLEEDDTGNSIWAHVRMVFNHCVQKSMSLSKEDKLKVRLAALLHDVGKPGSRQPKGDGSDRYLGHDKLGADMTKKILTQMRWKGNIVADVSELVGLHMNVHEITKIKKDHKARILLGNKLIELALILGWSDEAATINAPELKGNTPDLMDAAKQWREKFPVMTPDPIITGEDLKKAGVKPGPWFKPALDQAYKNQLDGEERKESLLKMALGVVKREQNKS